MVGAQALEFFVEIAVEGGAALDEVLGKLGGDVHPVADAVALQDGAERRLAAGVDVGRVEIVDAALDGGHDFLLRLLEVDDAGLLGETHAPVAEYRQLVPVFILSVLHDLSF